jgi:hypothetical protein
MSEESADLGTESLHAGRDQPGEPVLRCAAAGRRHACRALASHCPAGNALLVYSSLGGLALAEEHINHKQDY